MVLPNADVYIGEFSADLRNGQGKLTSAESGRTTTGNWIDDKPSISHTG
jgi:hypothetical protein